VRLIQGQRVLQTQKVQGNGHSYIPKVESYIPSVLQVTVLVITPYRNPKNVQQGNRKTGTVDKVFERIDRPLWDMVKDIFWSKDVKLSEIWEGEFVELLRYL
jgi:hypothetical protein